MKQWFSILSLAVCLSCAPKKNVAVAPVSPFDDVCRIELERLAGQDTSDVIYFNNTAMDAYRNHPGDSAFLYQTFLQRTDVCRGALLQLMLEVHPAEFMARWPALQADLTTADVLRLLDQTRKQADDTLDPVIIHYLHAKDPVIRSRAATSLSALDQAAAEWEISTFLQQETDPQVLDQAVLALNLDRYPNTARLLDELMKRPIPQLRSLILSTWAQSGLANKRELIQPHTQDPNAQTAATATHLLEMLATKDRLSLTVINPPQQVQAPIDPVKQTALEKAIFENDLSQIRDLVKAGAQLNVPDKYGRTPFSDALRRDTQTLELCIELGADLTAFPDGNALTHFARGGGYEDDNLRVLLAAGLDINSRTPDLKTPLMLAAEGNNATLVGELLANGADPSIRDDSGRTPLDTARLLEHDRVIALLEKAQP